MFAKLNKSVIAALCGGFLIASAAACGSRVQPEPDAGEALDAGTQPDAGNDPVDAGHDAGSSHQDAGHDAGTVEDAGMELDAGHPQDAGTAVDGGCGEATPATWAALDEREAFPDPIPSCYQSGTDCTRFYTVRITDAVTLAAFYAVEFQEFNPPVVNFNLADVIITYNCACPTRGHELKTHGVTVDACGLVTHGQFDLPGEGCFTSQTFTRMYSTIEVEKGTGAGMGLTDRPEVALNAYSCE